jgi:hypothetical protein
MKNRIFRRRGVLCTASATPAIVSRTHNPQRQRPSLNGFHGMTFSMIASASGEIPVLTSDAVIARSRRARSEVRFCVAPVLVDMTAARSSGPSWFTTAVALRLALMVGSPGGMVRSSRMITRRPWSSAA